MPIFNSLPAENANNSVSKVIQDLALPYQKRCILRSIWKRKQLFPIMLNKGGEEGSGLCFVIHHLTTKSCLVSLYTGLFKMLLLVDSIIHSRELSITRY